MSIRSGATSIAASRAPTFLARVEVEAMVAHQRLMAMRAAGLIQRRRVQP